MRKLALHWQILIAIVLAGIAGSIIFGYRESTGNEPGIFGIDFVVMFDYIGTLFSERVEDDHRAVDYFVHHHRRRGHRRWRQSWCAWR